MKQKPAFFISAALSVFILALIGGVVAFAGQPASLDANAFSDAEVAQLLANQEAVYSQMIDDANQQISQAQSVINDMQSGSADQAMAESISAEAAMQMASEVTGQLPSGAAELVNFEGAVAYEVPFLAGNVYLDAVSGELLFNGTITVVPADISAERAAQLATAYMGKNTIYKVEQTALNGELVYRVKFINGDAVFVSLKGNLLLVRLANADQTASNGNTSSVTPQEHEESEHEDHDDD